MATTVGWFETESFFHAGDGILRLCYGRVTLGEGQDSLILMLSVQDGGGYTAVHVYARPSSLQYDILYNTY